MSVDAYLQRQDKTFDTFRSTFDLGPASPLRVTKPVAELKNPVRSSANSTSTLHEILASAPDAVEDLKVQDSPMRFAPKMRRLDLAPWEGSSEANLLLPVESPEEDEANPEALSENKSKRPRGKGLFSKFRRATSGSSNRAVSNRSISPTPEPVSPVSQSSPVITYPAHQIATVQETAIITPSIISYPIPLIVHTEPPLSPPLTVITRTTTTITVDSPLSAPSLLTDRSEIPLGPVLKTPAATDEDTPFQFRPIDPNITTLRQPVEQQKPDASLYKSGALASASTPKLVCDFEGSTLPKDRMSRMFDNLEF